jgi:hypothetical protein
VPAALPAACALVGADVSQEPRVSAQLPTLRWWAGREDGDPAGTLVVGMSTDAGMLFGSGVDTTLGAAELTARLAEVVQDHLTGYEWITWPACPNHDHPMRPEVYDGSACWRCPDAPRPSARIGQWRLPRP